MKVENKWQDIEMAYRIIESRDWTWFEKLKYKIWAYFKF